ncbi:hypothetical protein KO527_05055 [Pseudoalteromonas sp. C2R02]|uniref:hypothetical protein n=1 Tax=Pseudoalteromonas sp. C2R02 TaxID=2841565 RepID=UPI001C09655C|nr:hypothetical protein [Pseudoalteromonas sp. C2R02]MBU2968715.1 hypothetical protein [Pseudoalteromonas sp. C2R02]
MGVTTEMAQIKIEQIPLMAVVCEEICNQQGGNVPAEPKLMNACIEAANLVKEKLDGFEYQPIADDTKQDSEIGMFSVIAGKYDDQQMNCKYSDEFETLDEAIEAYGEVDSYPWAYIQYKNRTLELWAKGNNPSV